MEYIDPFTFDLLSLVTFLILITPVVVIQLNIIVWVFRRVLLIDNIENYEL